MTVIAATNDQDLMDQIRRLVAVSAQEVQCVSSISQAQGGWGSASLVLVGSDLVADVRSAALPKRDQLVVVAHSGATDTIWREAMSVGAQGVVQLPDDEDWVADQLAAIAAEQSRRGMIVAALGGSGGVGASSFVAALGVAAITLGKSPVVVDLDPVGCGIDVVLGSDQAEPGVRWSELYRVSGRVPSKSLVSGLPSVNEIPVLSWGDQEPQLPTKEVVGVVLDSLKGSFDVVLVDLPRSSRETASVVLSRAQAVSFLAHAGVVGGVAAKRASCWLLESHQTVDLLIRPERGRGTDPTEIRDLGELLDIEPFLVVPNCKELAGELESGLPPGSHPKSKLGAVAREYLQGLDQLREAE